MKNQNESTRIKQATISTRWMGNDDLLARVNREILASSLDVYATRVTSYNGKDYAILRNARGPDVVYRVLNDGFLKRIKHYPKALGAGAQL
jgi:hypothetical protein